MSERNQQPDPEEDHAPAVERPGLIKVDSGDQIVPAPGSEAAVAARSGSEVHYYFPIHVVIAGGVTAKTGSNIANSIWNALYQALS